MLSEMGRSKWVWTDLPPRMAARRLASGKVLYYYQRAGKKVALGANRMTAVEEWARLESGAGRAQRLFPAIDAEYRQAMFSGFTQGTRAHYRIALDNLSLAFRAFSLEQIQPQHVKEYMRRRTKKGAAMFEKRVLSALFNWAREGGYTSSANPCRDVKFSKSERRGFAPLGKRKVYVTDDAFQGVYEGAGELVRDMMDLALLTGQRPSDLLKARRADIVDGVLWVDQQKTSARVGIKVQGSLAVVLERILTRARAVQSVYIIADQRGQRVRYGALNRQFRKARGAATWQFRDLRAKAATDMPDLKRAQLLLGHADEATTASVYRRVRGDAVAPLERKK